MVRVRIVDIRNSRPESVVVVVMVTSLATMTVTVVTITMTMTVISADDDIKEISS